MAMLLIVVAPFHNFAFWLHKGIVNMLLSHQLLDERKITFVSTTWAYSIIVEQTFHKEAHSLFVHVHTHQPVVRMVFANDTRQRTGCKAPDTCN